MRGIFFTDDDARAVAAELEQLGWTAEVTRERRAGEDDDEDHPWAVLTDAPALQLELLVDAHDGWLDDEPGTGGAAPTGSPVELPEGPKRIKRPQ